MGFLPKLSVATLKALLNGTEFQTRVENSTDSKFQLIIWARCLMPPGWTSLHLSSYDKDAFVQVFTYPTTPELGNMDVTIAEVAFHLHHPKEIQPWFMNITMSAQTESTTPIIILTENMNLTIFPRVESSLGQIKSEVRGTPFPGYCFENSVCVLELSTLTKWPVYTLMPGLLFRLMTALPITPESQWRALFRYRITRDRRRPVSIADSELTRFYSKNEPWLHHQFGPLVDGDRIHHVAFVFMP